MVDDISQPTRRLSLSALIRLRWGALLGQVVLVITVATFMSFPISWGAAVSLIAAMAASNLALYAGRAHVENIERWTFWGLVVDLLLFTDLLAVSGGASNPFSFLYVLYISLGALMLSGRGPWVVAGVAVAGYGSLYLGAIGVGWAPSAIHGSFQQHLYGMWFALAVTGAMIAYFIAMIRAELDRRRQQLDEMREVRARRDKLAALARMAAGAAHELATPISTIAVVANELKRLAEQRGEEEFAEDAGVIRHQVDRCEEILARMAADAGQAGRRSISEVDPLDAALAAQRRCRAPQRVSVDAELPQACRIEAPFDALVANLTALVDNGLLASDDDAIVDLSVHDGATCVEFRVRDTGCGMSEKTRRYAREPFFSTREPGEGMGLGLYLVAELVDALHGHLTIDSHEGRGTTVHMQLPKRLRAPGAIDG